MRLFKKKKEKKLNIRESIRKITDNLDKFEVSNSTQFLYEIIGNIAGAFQYMLVYNEKTLDKKLGWGYYYEIIIGVPSSYHNNYYNCNNTGIRLYIENKDYEIPKSLNMGFTYGGNSEGLLDFTTLEVSLSDDEKELLEKAVDKKIEDSEKNRKEDRIKLDEKNRLLEIEEQSKMNTIENKSLNLIDFNKTKEK